MAAPYSGLASPHFWLKTASADMARSPKTEVAAPELKAKLDELTTLLAIKKEYCPAFEALATTHLFEMATKNTPTPFKLTVTFLQRYGAAIWPASLSQRDHLAKMVGDSRHAHCWRITGDTPRATVNGPVFAIHATMTSRNGFVSTKPHPNRHQNRLTELLWEYFGYLREIGVRGALEGRVMEPEQLLAIITENA